MHCAPRYLPSALRLLQLPRRRPPPAHSQGLPARVRQPSGRSVISELVAVALPARSLAITTPRTLHTPNTPPCRKTVRAPATTPRSRAAPRPEGPSCPCARPPAPGLSVSTSLARFRPLPPQMQPSTSMGRESQIRIEPWANPAKVTYVVRLGPPFLPSRFSPAGPSSSYLAATRSRDPAAWVWETGMAAASWARGRLPCHRLHLSANWRRGAIGRWRRGAGSDISVGRVRGLTVCSGAGILDPTDQRSSRR